MLGSPQRTRDGTGERTRRVVALLGAAGLLTFGIGAGVRIGAGRAVAIDESPAGVEMSRVVVVETPTTIDETPPIRDADPIDGVHGDAARPASVSTPPAAMRTGTDDMRWFGDRPVRRARTLSMIVTAYSPDERSCGRFADGITASGYSVWTNGMSLVAADTDVLPFGTLISVPGYDSGGLVPVLDRGGKIKGRRLDVLFPTHRQAMRWGVQELTIEVWEYADGRPGEFVRRR